MLNLSSVPQTGNQILTLTGLRFAASLGILEQEKTAPQPIQVDAELNQGPQALRRLLPGVDGRTSRPVLQFP